MGGRPATAVVFYPDGTPTVALSGELDLLVAATIERRLVEFSDTHDHVDLDVSAVEFIDAAGLHALVRRGAPCAPARTRAGGAPAPSPLAWPLDRPTGVGPQLGL